MPNNHPDGFDLERVLTLIRNDISGIRADVADIKSGQAALVTKVDILIDSTAATTTRVVELERTRTTTSQPRRTQPPSPGRCLAPLTVFVADDNSAAAVVSSRASCRCPASDPLASLALPARSVATRVSKSAPVTSGDSDGRSVRPASRVGTHVRPPTIPISGAADDHPCHREPQGFQMFPPFRFPPAQVGAKRARKRARPCAAPGYVCHDGACGVVGTGLGETGTYAEAPDRSVGSPRQTSRDLGVCNNRRPEETGRNRLRGWDLNPQPTD